MTKNSKQNEKKSAKATSEDFSDILAASQTSFDFWDNKKDDILNLTGRRRVKGKV